MSRVINNNDYVNAETRQKILEAVEALNYRPHRAARSLASNRSLIIGLTVLAAYALMLTFGDNEGLLSLDEASFAEVLPGIE